MGSVGRGDSLLLRRGESARTRIRAFFLEHPYYYYYYYYTTIYIYIYYYYFYYYYIGWRTCLGSNQSWVK